MGFRAHTATKDQALESVGSISLLPNPSRPKTSLWNRSGAFRCSRTLLDQRLSALDSESFLFELQRESLTKEKQQATPLIHTFPTRPTHFFFAMMQRKKRRKIRRGRAPPPQRYRGRDKMVASRIKGDHCTRHCHNQTRKIDMKAKAPSSANLAVNYFFFSITARSCEHTRAEDGVCPTNLLYHIFRFDCAL